MRCRRFLALSAALLAPLVVACAQKAVAPEDSITPISGTENVGIISADDVVLAGRLFGSQNDVAVILSHMRPNDQTAWYADTPEHLLVQYDNSQQLFQLTALSTDTGTD